MDVWLMENEEIYRKPIASKIIQGATNIRFLPYAGAPVLAIVVNKKLPKRCEYRVQLWEIEDFEERLLKDSDTSSFELKELTKSKAGVHENHIRAMACVRDVVFSADTGVLKTWILSGWQLDQWLVRTHQGRPENLRLNRGTIHHGVNERHVKTRVKAIYATFYPLGKCESQRAGKLPTGATVLFTCSDEKVIVWKVLRSGPHNMNIDMKEMYEIKIGSADSDCEVFTGQMACTYLLYHLFLSARI
mgnify:CR=1 FL=1